jgi:hypothetical protein
MEQPASDAVMHQPADGSMRRREALKLLAGGAVVGALLVTGCAPPGAPTPVTTSTPSPTWTPGPSGTRDGTQAHA